MTLPNRFSILTVNCGPFCVQLHGREQTLGLHCRSGSPWPFWILSSSKSTFVVLAVSALVSFITWHKIVNNMYHLFRMHTHTHTHTSHKHTRTHSRNGLPVLMQVSGGEGSLSKYALWKVGSCHTESWDISLPPRTLAICTIVFVGNSRSLSVSHQFDF